MHIWAVVRFDLENHVKASINYWHNTTVPSFMNHAALIQAIDDMK